MGFSKSSAKRKVHSNTRLPQETRKNQINNLTLHLKQLEKEEMKNPKSLQMVTAAMKLKDAYSLEGKL